jgi:hypothetical protein
MDDEMESFINHIKNIYDLTIYKRIGMTSDDFFTSGGCYILAKIVSEICPKATIMINRNIGHCAILYNDKLYNIMRKSDRYEMADNIDINYMEEYYNYLSPKESNRIYNELKAKISVNAINSLLNSGKVKCINNLNNHI